MLQLGQPADSDWTFESEFGGQVALKLIIEAPKEVSSVSFSCNKVEKETPTAVVKFMTDDEGTDIQIVEK